MCTQIELFENIHTKGFVCLNGRWGERPPRYVRKGMKVYWWEKDGDMIDPTHLAGIEKLPENVVRKEALVLGVETNYDLGYPETYLTTECDIEGYECDFWGDEHFSVLYKKEGKKGEQK